MRVDQDSVTQAAVRAGQNGADGGSQRETIVEKHQENINNVKDIGHQNVFPTGTKDAVLDGIKNAPSAKEQGLKRRNRDR